MNKKRFQFKNVVIISLTHLIHDVFSSFLAPILPLLITKLHFSFAMAGLLSAIQRLPSLLSPLIGLVADKIRLRYVLIIAPAITTTAMSLLGLAPNLPCLIGLLIIMGIGAALFHVPAPVMIKKVSGDQIGKGMSFYMLGGELARSLGPILILAAVSWWGLEGTYRLMFLGWSASAIMYFQLKDIPISVDKTQKQNSTVQSTLSQHYPFFATLFGLVVTRGMMRYAMTLFLPLYLTQKGVSLWIAGLSLALLQFSGAFGTILIGQLSDTLGRFKTLLTLSILSPILMGGFILASGPYKAIFIVLFGFILYAMNPVVLALVQDLKTDRPSFINGIYLAVNFGGAALAAYLVGLLSDLYGIVAIYPITAGIGVLVVGFVFLLKKV